MSLEDDDRPFHHYSLRHRITAWVSLNLCDSLTYTVRHGLLRGMRRRGGLGWVPQMFTGGLHSREEDFFHDLDLRGKVVYDVGAFHGLMALFFARPAKTVVCFEPNPRNRTRLTENLELNQLRNVLIRPFGLGAEPQDAVLSFLPLMPGGGSLEEKTVTQLRQNPATQSEQIHITTLDLEVAQENLPPPDFIKIDIEGYEIEALRGAYQTLLQYRPALFLEMHGETMREKRRKVAEIVNFVTGLGYGSIQHVETGAVITPANSEVAVEGHLYCTF